MSYTNYNRTYRRSRIAEPAQLTSNANLFTPTADQKHMLGCIYDCDDGRRFRYQKADSTALTIALGNQSATGTANWQNEVQTNSPSIPTAGDTTVTVTATATATKNALADGYLTVEDGTGENNMYIIKSNKAGTANATTGYDIVLELADAGGVRTAWAATSELTLTKNKYRDVVVFPTDPTGVFTGVNLTAVTANYYFWDQTRGPVTMTNGSDTIVVGDEVTCGGQAAGRVSLPDNGTAIEGDTGIGFVMRAAGSGETALIDLTIE